MENIKQMRVRHKGEISALQGSCPHRKHSRMPYMWAPGHFGNDVEVCDNCGKILDHYANSDIQGGDVAFTVTGRQDEEWESLAGLA